MRPGGCGGGFSTPTRGKNRFLKPICGPRSSSWGRWDICGARSWSWASGRRTCRQSCPTRSPECSTGCTSRRRRCTMRCCASTCTTNWVAIRMKSSPSSTRRPSPRHRWGKSIALDSRPARKSR